MSRVYITHRQEFVLRTLALFTVEHGYPPTLRELMPLIGVKSTNGVNDHLAALERKGLIARIPKVSRGLLLNDAGRTWIAQQNILRASLND